MSNQAEVDDIVRRCFPGIEAHHLECGGFHKAKSATHSPDQPSYSRTANYLWLYPTPSVHFLSDIFAQAFGFQGNISRSVRKPRLPSIDQMYPSPFDKAPSSVPRTHQRGMEELVDDGPGGGGRDLTSSAYAHNGHPTRYMSADQKKEYAKRLQGGKGQSYIALAWESAKTLAEMIYMRPRPAHFLGNSRRRDCRFTSCTKCGMSSIGTFNLKHSCVPPDTPVDDLNQAIKDVNPKAGRENGSVSISLVFVHDVLDHPTCGFDTLGTGTTLEDWLKPLGVQSLESLPILKANASDYKGIFDFSEPGRQYQAHLCPVQRS